LKIDAGREKKRNRSSGRTAVKPSTRLGMCVRVIPIKRHLTEEGRQQQVTDQHYRPILLGGE